MSARSPRNARAQVEPGQVWADMDPRSRGRLVQVMDVSETHATVEVVRAGPGLIGRCRGQRTQRRTRIRLDRFRPNRTGYRLAHAHETAALDTDR